MQRRASAWLARLRGGPATKAQHSCSDGNSYNATARRSSMNVHLETGADFNGPEYSREHDHARLTGQILRVWRCMRDSRWRTLGEISAVTGDPHASVSAQLRHLRKEKFG